MAGPAKHLLHGSGQPWNASYMFAKNISMKRRACVARALITSIVDTVEAVMISKKTVVEFSCVIVDPYSFQLSLLCPITMEAWWIIGKKQNCWTQSVFTTLITWSGLPVTWSGLPVRVVYASNITGLQPSEYGEWLCRETVGSYVLLMSESPVMKNIRDDVK